MKLKGTNKGFTLVEMLLTSLITTGLLIVFFMAFTLFWKTYLSRADNTQFFQEAHTVQAYLRNDVKKADSIDVSPCRLSIQQGGEEIVYLCDDGNIYREGKPLVFDIDEAEFSEETIEGNKLIKLFLKNQWIKLQIWTGQT